MSRKHPNFGLHKALNWWYRNLRPQPFVTFFKVIFGFVIAVAVATICLAEFSDPSDQEIGGFMEEYLQWFYTHRFFIVCIIVIVQSICGFLIWLLNWFADHSGIEAAKVKTVLNRLVGKVFEPRTAEHTYRATLFRERRFLRVFRWLGVVQRSGDVYTDWSTIFSINPNSLDQNTGIVGECWFRAQSGLGGSFYLELKKDTEDPEVVEEYTREGFLDPKEYKQLTVRALFFRACEIRHNGKVWGVLVVDSTDESVYPRSHHANRKQTEAMENAADTISLLIG